MCYLYAGCDSAVVLGAYSKFDTARKVAETTVDPRGKSAEEIVTITRKCSQIFNDCSRYCPAGCYFSLDGAEMSPGSVVVMRSATRRMVQIASEATFNSHL